MTPMKSMMDEVEDYLQEQGVFVNGLTDRPAHMDSYMTVMDFQKLDKALASCPFTAEQMLNAAEGMEGFAYLSPMASLTSKILKRKYGPTKTE